MKINFKNAESMFVGIDRIKDILDFEISDDGVEVEAVKSDRIGASLKDGKGTIYYADKPTFFRELGQFIENAKKADEFSVFDAVDFDTVGVMLDVSRNGVMTVDSIKRYIDYMAVMGYNMCMIYTEDVFEIKERPYFGYMRGRYTFDELKACDDYAFEYGIEMIPCIEAYGHMEKYLIWPEAANVKDTASVMLADNEETYELLELMIKSVTAPFRSKRIHIGMDEAWDMGRGKYLDKFGYVEPFEIFNHYMARLVEITDKYGLTPMMWSDMYFRIAAPKNDTETDSYYCEETVIPQEIKDKIPENIQLVYWHYGEKPGCDEYMIEKHKDLNRDVIFASGLWTWTGHMPENNYGYEATRAGIAACKKYGVREMMATVWYNDNAQSDPFSSLMGLSFTAELVYKNDPDMDTLKSRFEACTGGDFKAFWDMSEYHNTFNDGSKYDDFHERFLGEPLFWQDVLEGLFDSKLYAKPMSAHYREYANKMRAYSGKWDNTYRFTEKVFAYLAIKTEIAEKIKPAYDRGDKTTLAEIADKLLPELISRTVEVHESNRKLWYNVFKGNGWGNLEIRYAGVKARAETAIILLHEYLSGERTRIDELAEPRLDKPLSGFINYREISSPNLYI